MGYYVQSYLTDSSEIRKLYGSKNKELLASLLHELSEDLNNLNQYFSEELGDDKNSQKILTDIINGEVRFPKLAFMYGYVYEKLCDYYGEQVFPPNDEYSTDYYWSINKETYKAFVPIPFSNDFPEIYSILTTELQEEKERFLAPTKIRNVEDEDVESAKEDFKYIFEEALKKNKDLVFFLY